MPDGVSSSEDHLEWKDPIKIKVKIEKKGVNLLNGKEIPGKCTLKLKKGDIITIKTPG